MLKDTGNSIFGFQLTALDVFGERQGDMIITNTSNTFITTNQGREYIIIR